MDTSIFPSLPDTSTLPSLPVTLTFVAYVLLGILATWIVAHWIGLIHWLIRRPDERWKTKADSIARNLDGLREELGRRRVEMNRARQREDHSLYDASCSQFHDLLRRGPQKDLVRWLKSQRCPSALRETVELSSNSEERTARLRHSQSASSVLRPYWSAIQVRCNLAAAIAPFAGAAPTMSGAQIFIDDWSKAAATAGDLPDLSGISAALTTTCIGCFLAIAAVLALFVFYVSFQRAESTLTIATNRILDADARWQKERNSAQRFLDKERDQCSLTKTAAVRSPRAV